MLAVGIPSAQDVEMGRSNAGRLLSNQEMYVTIDSKVAKTPVEFTKDQREQVHVCTDVVGFTLACRRQWPYLEWSCCTPETW